jgi:hypothetical protein
LAKDINTILLRDVSQLIEAAKAHVASFANITLVILYWQIGQRIHQDVLKSKRAGYGEQVIKQLAHHLSTRYGSGFDIPNLTRMIRFTKLYPEKQIVVTLSQQLSWSHFVKLITIDEPLKRDFYTEMCQLERWNVRNLRQKVDSMLYERTALAKQPKSVIKTELKKLKQGNLANPDLFLQDPCILKFLYPKSTHQNTT